MRNLILTIALLSTIAIHAQFTINIGAMPFNQDHQNPISWGELTDLARMHDVSNLGELPEDILDRLDGIGQSFNVGIGVDIPFGGEFRVQNVDDATAGISLNADAFIQYNQNNAYKGIATSVGAGAFIDFGLRMEVGAMTFYGQSVGWYLDAGARIIKKRVYIFTRYQRASPFTDVINSQFILDGSYSTLETLSAGVRFKF